MAENFADRLLGAIEAAGAPVCVGIDPVAEQFPPEMAGGDLAYNLKRFCLGVLEAVAGVVPAVKPQIACFERYGEKGLCAYDLVVSAARRAGLVVIGDVKRGDIGSTAAHYAAAHLDGPESPDAVTVNGYFGADGIAPFAEVARRRGRGVFVLVRTSNPSAAGVQDVADAAGKRFCEHLAEQVAAVGSAEGLTGGRGYCCVGAVVGATSPDEARRLREIMPQQIFLVPGYGAQGASAADCAAAFKPDGTGAIVNASRSVIYAFRRGEHAGGDWRKAIAAAARAFAADVASAVGRR